uniref:Helicase ATP-binding domain-containing protein n=1 Tax=Fagus sylvatica TaxID=28930 RepID=A0A2N9HAX4_FAGSY
MAQLEAQTQSQTLEPSVDHVDKTKSLICALNLVSRNLPLPPDLYDAVSSIYLSPEENDTDADLNDDAVNAAAGSVAHKALEEYTYVYKAGGVLVYKYLVCMKRLAIKGKEKEDHGSSKGDLLADFEDALLEQRPNCMSGFGLTALREKRYQSHIGHRLTELEVLPSNRGEDVQTKCLLELYGLKLAELQSKVRSEVNSEYWLRVNCAEPDKQLFDWGMMRLRRPLYGVGDAFAMDADDQFRKKRDAERLSRLEEEEKNLVETRKRKFFAEVLNAVREFQLQIQASMKRRRQRNDGVLSWHGRQRQRATRQEKLRFQALKADDQEAYMRMVKESKNERLTMLLEETNKLLVNLGAAVKRQKDAKHSDGIEALKESEADLPELDASNDGTPQDLLPEKEMDIIDSNRNVETSDLLEGQRQYNSAIHSIQEKVTEQPSMLQGGELRPYQVEGLQWMVSLFNNSLNGILADEMGLGKTIQTISLIAYLMENKGVTGPHLIVAPKAVLPNWSYEFSMWAPSIAAYLYDGRLDERKAMREELSGEGKFNVLITHYDLIMRDKAFLKKIHWYYMIVDEGHRLKNHESVLAKTLVSGYQIQRRLLLTGTPIQNSLQELWALLNFLLPHIFNSVQNFEEWFNAPFAGAGKSKGLQNLTMQLRKCCNHPYLFVAGDYNMWRKEEIARASGKFELLDRLLPKLHRAGHRVLLFSQMTRLLDILEIYLQLHDYKYLRLDGNTKTESRGALVDEFNAPSSPYFMFLLSTRAGGLGLNLQTADTVILFDIDWNPQMDQQAEDRAHRIGQKKEVRVFVLITVGSVEEAILERAKQKMGIDAKVIQAGLFNTTSTAQDSRQMLEQIMRRGTSSLGTDVPSEREINRLACRSEEEFWMFEKMDEERRQKEKYRSRLMEEHEVPEWAYSAPEIKEDEVLGVDGIGKRKRKEVVYADTLSDLQWMKAMESGEDISRLPSKRKKKDHLATEGNASTRNIAGAEEKVLELGNENIPMTNEDTFGLAPTIKRPKSEEANAEKHEYQGVGGSNWNGHLLTWNTHKKKRSSFVVPSTSSDSRGQNSNGRGSGWS